MLVTKTIEIDMGHRVPNHKSKCRNFHGHRYKIEVGVDDKVCDIQGVSDEGMVIDYGDLKKIMMEVIDKQFDHGFCIYEGDEFAFFFNNAMHERDQKIIFVPFIPTAENLAKHWFGLIAPKLLDKNILLRYVKVWETPTSTATYEVV